MLCLTTIGLVQQTVCRSGWLTASVDRKVVNLRSRLRSEFSGGNQPFADQQGNFKITFTQGKEKSFDFFVFGVAVDTMLISSVHTFDSDTPEMTFYIPGLRKRNFLGQIICPKCGKADKVLKIEYGMLPIKMHISDKGDTTYSDIENGRYNAGTCVAGVAKYFCDRDKVKF